jgi:hypothetical protein
MVSTRFIQHRSGGKKGPCENSNGPSGSTKGTQFLDWLRDYKLIRKDSLCSIKLFSLV